MTRIKNAYSAALLVALMASGVAAARVRPSALQRQNMSASEASALDSQACRESSVSRRRRAENMCSCRRRNSNSDLPSGYTCSGDNSNGRDTVIKKSSRTRRTDGVKVNASSNHGTKCDHCYDIGTYEGDLWEERSVCFLRCGESVYFPQSLALYGQITSKYAKIGIYQIRLDRETRWRKTMYPLKFEWKYVARTNRPKVLIKFHDAEPDEYSLHCPFADCDGGRDSCRNERSEHDVSFKINNRYGYKRPKLVGFDVTWPLG